MSSTAQPARRRPSALRANLAANFLGSTWLAALQLAVVPLYLRLIGVEAYGLIGFVMSLQGAMRAFDFGMSATANRELARYAVRDERGEAAAFLRTLESIAWGMALVIGAGFVLAAPWLAHDWLNRQALPAEELVVALTLAGILIALQWPLTLYYGGLMGRQRQVAANAARSGFTTAGVLAGLAGLVWVEATPTVVLAAMLGAASLQLVVLAWLLWRTVDGHFLGARFSSGVLRRHLRFAAGMGGIGLTAMLLSQLDRLVLSALVPLDVFGYYVLGFTLGSALYVLIQPIHGALLPRFTGLLASGDGKALRDAYRTGSQLMAAAVAPAALGIVLFAHDLLLVWTGLPLAAAAAAPVAMLIAAGTGLNGFMHMPYALQIASGRTRIGLTLNTGFVLTLVPALFVAVAHWGIVGAAAVWLVLNAVYTLLGAPWTHRYVLPGELREWFVSALARPVLAAGAVLLTAALLARGLDQAAHRLALAAAGVLLAMLACAWLGETTRPLLREAVAAITGRGARDAR